MGTYYDSALYDSGFLYDAVDQLGVRDLRVELFYGAQWTNHTVSVRTEEGIRLGRGRSSEDGEASPAWCDLTFDNVEGKYSPRNTSGVLYGLIKRNTPLRVGFGKPVVGPATTGTGTSVSLAQIVPSNGYGDVATMAVAITSSEVNLSTPSGYGNATEQDATGAFTVKRAFSTENNVVAASSMTASGSSSWASVHLAVPGGTYVVSDGGTATLGESPAAADLSALADGDLVVAVCGWTSDPYGRMGAPYFPLATTPTEVYLVADSGPDAGPRITAWAWRHRAGSAAVGFVGALDGATGATMQIAVFSGAAAYAPRFCGEVGNWPLAWSKGEHDKTVSVRANGVLGRMAQSTDTVSALRSALISQADLTAYWPMEDGAGATSFAPAIGGRAMVPVNGIAPAEVEDVAGALALPSFTGRGARGPVSPPNSAPWGFGGVVAIPTAGTAVGNNLIVGECAGGGGDISSFGIEYTSSTSITVKAAYTDGTTASSALTGGSFAATFPNGIHGKQIFVYVALAQSGGNVAWSVSLINVTPTEAMAQVAASGSLTTKTVGPLVAVTAGVEAGTSATLGTNDVSMGHLFVTTGANLNFSIYRTQAARAYAGAPITEAAMTIARDAGYRMAFVYPVSDTAVAGVVEASATAQQMRDLAAASQALLSDAAGFVGLEWRPLPTVVSRTPVFEFDYDAGTFTDPMRPTDDVGTGVTLNDAEVESTSGGRARVVIETGALGAQPGGVGRYAASYRLPVNGPVAAEALAGWLVGQGTLDAQRWPEVGLEMSAPGNAELPLGQFSIGDTVRLSNLPSFQGPTEVDLVIVGFEEELDEALWRVTLICRHAGAYRALIWDDAEFGLWADATAPTATDNRWSL